MKRFNNGFSKSITDRKHGENPIKSPSRKPKLDTGLSRNLSRKKLTNV